MMLCVALICSLALPYVYYMRNHNLCIHFIVDGSVGCVQLLVVTTDTAVNILVNICGASEHELSTVYIWKWIAGSCILHILT